MNVAIEACTGIPARRVGEIFQTDCKLIAARMHRPGNIDIEGIITIRPEADLFSVDEYVRVAHCTVEDQRRPLAGGHLETASVPSAAHIRQAAGASGLKRGLFLVILRNRHVLKIVLTAERAVDSPIVGYAHFLPGGIVISGGRGLGGISTMELPPLLQQHFAPLGEG